MFEKMVNKGVGTNKAETVAKSLAKDCSVKGKETKEQLRKVFLQNIMNIKLEDAKKEVKVEDFKFHNQKKRANKVINNRETMEKARNFINKEAEHEWNENKKRLDNKLNHLEKKHTNKEDIKDNIKGVKVSDEALGAKQPASEPNIYNIDKETITNNV